MDGDRENSGDTGRGDGQETTAEAAAEQSAVKNERELRSFEERLVGHDGIYV